MMLREARSKGSAALKAMMFTQSSEHTGEESWEDKKAANSRTVSFFCSLKWVFSQHTIPGPQPQQQAPLDPTGTETQMPSRKSMRLTVLLSV